VVQLARCGRRARDVGRGDQPAVVECAGDLPVGSVLDTSVPGDHEFTVTASDEFGKTTSTTVSYHVVFDFSGFQEPVGDGLYAAQAGP
jgi:hypothetical protein